MCLIQQVLLLYNSEKKTDTFHPTEHVVNGITFVIFTDHHTPCKREVFVPILQMRKPRLRMIKRNGARITQK